MAKHRDDAAMEEFETALAHVNEILVARGESPIGMDDILNDRPMRKYRPPFVMDDDELEEMLAMEEE